jgi:hypothetical protein
MQIEQSTIERIKQLCKANNVKSLFAFGSVLREDFNAQSDIDLIVDFEEKDPFTYADLYFNLKNLLEELFNRNIDLLEERAIRNPLFKKEIDKTKVLIYG